MLGKAALTEPRIHVVRFHGASTLPMLPLVLFKRSASTHCDFLSGPKKMLVSTKQPRNRPGFFRRENRPMAPVRPARCGGTLWPAPKSPRGRGRRSRSECSAGRGEKEQREEREEENRGDREQRLEGQNRETKEGGREQKAQRIGGAERLGRMGCEL